MSLRLGTSCAVIDDQGRVLLSQRSDLRVWNLPGGRVDSGELLAEAAVREVREETGVVATIDRAVGMYYWAGFQRLNILYAGWPLGGELLARTAETRENQYVAPDAMPKMLHGAYVDAVFNDTRPWPEIVAMSDAELRRLRRRLRLRWVGNLLQGHPEPRFPRFDVRAVALIWEQSHKRVLTLQGKRGRTLPRLRCSGQDAPWLELRARVKRQCAIAPAFQWVGLWQDPARDVLEFVFAATIPERRLSGSAEWSGIMNAPLGDRDMRYVEQVGPDYPQDPVWTLRPEDDLDDDDLIITVQ